MTSDLTDDRLDRLLADAAPRTPEFVPPGSVRETIVTSKRVPASSLGRRLRLRWILAPAAAALALMAVLLAGPQRDGSIETANAATRILNRAADTTERARPYPQGRLRYTRETESLGDGPFVIETWRRADGSIARRVVTRRVDAREAPAPDAAGLPWTGLNDQQILALPSRPDALLAAIRGAMARPQPVMVIGADGHSTTRTTRVPFTDRQVFTAMMALHDVELPLTNQQRAGLLRAAAMIPGVTSLGRVRDPLGRTGDAISIRSDGPAERVYVLSPTTGHTIATLDVRHGVVVGWSTRQEAPVTGTGQRPHLAASAGLPERYRFDAAKVSP